ncbi:MAG: hypothetical protein AABX48_04780 [Nanoarchaeota archaeon]
MVNITLSVPEELKKKMERHKIINWSALAREAIEKRIIILEEIDKFTAESEFTKEDAIVLGRKVNKAAAQRFKELTKKKIK